ncbi:MAG: LTA synthase family protein [Oscillospiraceae bacterium]|nr:LTA synthase family protein [Oscillospiraceae bacterium]
MKSLMKPFFLFSAQTETDWTLWKKIIFWGWRIALLLCGGMAVGYISLKFAYGAYPNSAEIFGGYLASVPLLLLNLLPAAWLTLALYGIFGRAWAAFALSGATVLALSLGNFFKIVFRDDPLYFEDLLIIREAGNMAEEYTLFMDKRIALAVFCFIGGTAALFFLARGVLRGWKLRGGVLLTAVVSGVLLFQTSLDQGKYNALGNYEYLNQWSQTQNYIAHGFLYPFIHSIGETLNVPPDGYSEKRAEELLSVYADADIPEDKRVNLITIMREAYVDFSEYDVAGLDVSGYELYHSLQAESYSGKLLTNIFAGGTVDSERCFLTGNYALKNFRANTNSYLWYLRSQGYAVEGNHPYHQWFYNRQNINKYLGFEHYRFLENDYEELCDEFYVLDSVLYPEIYRDFEENKETGKPYFSFNLNIQSHGPYYTDICISPEEYLTGNYSEGCKNAMNNYMNEIMQGDAQLMALVDQLRQDEEPVVLVVYSDHLPWMGDSNVFYEELGINIDPEAEDSFRRRYETDYLIWANDAAKEVLGNDFIGQGPTISPCYLMNLTFDLCGWEGPAFMQAMDDIREVFPVVTTNNFMVVDDVFTDTVPDNRKQLYQDFLYLQHYWKSEWIS